MSEYFISGVSYYKNKFVHQTNNFIECFFSLFFIFVICSCVESLERQGKSNVWFWRWWGVTSLLSLLLWFRELTPHTAVGYYLPHLVQGAEESFSVVCIEFYFVYCYTHWRARDTAECVASYCGRATISDPRAIQYVAGHNERFIQGCFHPL